MTDKKMLTLSPSPHIKGADTTMQIMLTVIVALLPAFFVGVLFFGLAALKVTLAAVAACILFEWIIQRFMMRTSSTVWDMSAALSGLLLAFNLPSGLPLWMVVVGAFVTIGIGKLSFGGLGQNIFNPALVGRVFLLISFPVHMTSWPVPGSEDSVTGATALSLLKEGLDKGDTVSELMMRLPKLEALFWGSIGGSLGEVSAFALLIGGIYLLIKKVITWHIPLSFIGTVALLSGLMWWIDPAQYASPMFHLLSGGIVLGAFFMATDMVTSPMAVKGQILFGIGCGLLTIVIRLWGGYPEGVSFAILIMNAFVPLIDRAFRQKRFGVN